MWKPTTILTLVVIALIIHQALLLPLDAPETGSGRRGRCFNSIWNFLRGETKRLIDENIISQDPNQIHFFLYPNPYDPDYYEEIIYDDIPSLQKANFRFGGMWKFLIHGYTMNQYGQFPQNVKNAYLEEYRNKLSTEGQQTQGYNVVIVDWGALADPKLTGNVNFLLMYSFAVRNVKTVGIRVGEFIQFLRRQGAMESYSNCHIVGFSLGAHCAGNAGFTVLNSTGEKVSRITGLDPAGPNFYLELKGISSPKLSKEYGKFVDVYHSNQGEFGTMSKLGHIDFYPNGGGPNQPSCYEQYTKAGENKSVEELGSCSHNAAPRFFSESISSTKPQMIACGCDSYEEFKSTCDCVSQAVFGEYAGPRTRGSYYIDVQDTI